MQKIDLYSTEQVAATLGVTVRTLANYIKEGRITGQKIGGTWKFTETEIQRFMTGETQRGIKTPAALARMVPGLLDEIEELNAFILQAMQQAAASGRRDGIEFDLAGKMNSIMTDHVQPMRKLSRAKANNA